MFANISYLIEGNVSTMYALTACKVDLYKCSTATIILQRYIYCIKYTTLGYSRLIA